LLHILLVAITLYLIYAGVRIIKDVCSVFGWAN